VLRSLTLGENQLRSIDIIHRGDFPMMLEYSARSGSCFEEKDDVVEQRYIGRSFVRSIVNC